MKKSYIMKTVCAVSVTAACAWGLAACTTSSTSDSTASTGAVAGTVNGVEVAEDSITNYIQSVRENLGAADEESWGTWLAQNEYTPASVREEVFTSYAQLELIKEGAEEKNITVDQSEIDQNVEKMRQYYDTDEKWQSVLEQAGLTEEGYRDQIESDLKRQKLYASFATDEEASETDLLSYAQMYASAYDGAKRSSHILFDAADEATAQEVLDKINSGELDFVDAVKEYSTDSVATEQDGDVGWDKGSSLDETYVAAVEALEKDQVSGLVTTDYGIHIIKCTDVFTAPEEVTSIDQIPSEWVDSIKTSLANQKQQEAYQQWLQEAQEAADIVINDMPAGLPYDLDMTKYATDSTTDGSTEGTADGSADGDAAATDGADDAAATDEGATEGDAGADASGEENATSGQPAEAA